MIRENGGMKPILSYSSFESPIGKLFICSSEKGLASLSWARPEGVQENDNCSFAKIAQRQLNEYFDGLRSSFQLDLAPQGTEFQLRVWNELQLIKFGETLSYKELAKKVGSPRGHRAVGGANGQNPLPIIVPCHRVISSDGRLGGYSGGAEIKKKLLRMEGVLVP